MNPANPAGKPREMTGATPSPKEHHGKPMGKPWENHGKTIGKPKNGWFIRENPMKMDDDLGVPPIFENLHLAGLVHTIFTRPYLELRPQSFPCVRNR